MLITVIGLILQFLPVVLKSVGVNSNLTSLITDLAGEIPSVIAALTSGGTVSDKVLTLLQDVQTELKALQGNTNLDATALAEAASLDGAITDALAAYQTGTTTTDPSTLTPLPTNL